MKVLVLFFSLILFSPIVFSNQSFGIDFVDSTGYTPSWAKGSGYHSVLLKCTELVGDYSRDGDWCMEWTAYVLDQGIENFPESTSNTSKIRFSEKDLVQGEIYSGSLKTFLPSSTFYGNSWLMGSPFQPSQSDSSSSAGLKDHAVQLIFAPDYNDEKGILITIIILEFENDVAAKEVYVSGKTQTKSKIDSSPNILDIKRFHIIDFADCVGTLRDAETKDESAGLQCIKGNYIVAVASKQLGGFVTSKNLEDLFVDRTSVEIAEEVVRKISNLISFSSGSLDKTPKEGVIKTHSKDIHLLDTESFERVPSIVNISWDESYGAGDEIPFAITFFDENRDLVSDVRYAYFLIDENNQVIEKNTGDDPDYPGIIFSQGYGFARIYVPSEGQYNLDILVYGTGPSYDPTYSGITTMNFDVGPSLKKEVIPTPKTTPTVEVPSYDISEQVKNNAGWWSGNIDDDAIFVQITPSSVSSRIDSGNLLVRFFDQNTDENFINVTYRVEIWRDDQLLARNLFYDLDGELNVEIKPVFDCSESYLWKCTQYFGSENSNSPGALFEYQSGRPVIEGPILDKSGLYNVRIDIEGGTNSKMTVDGFLSYDAFIHITDENTISEPEKSSIFLPKWVKTNAQWWSTGQISDKTFVQAIQFMIKEGHIRIPTTHQTTTSSEAEIPEWIKNNAGWWAEDLITDADFAKGIEYLVNNGIMSVY